jgi:hypothetical protein
MLLDTIFYSMIDLNLFTLIKPSNEEGNIFVLEFSISQNY